ncbi:ectoine hydroxylase [Actimicrobium sp. CCC2.4]|uniref:ectoine hydroxylase n=1 Tax=Actimicrobium sp. CCC2.4 TaxID=3048606 RepID=UPI002AC94405|nr:ectoine hydroxylase [Actimicrobium sp. CCC2.4]MEB0134342.1 ectoine hydroxylase [Actimicrobium sp. CCC2.4]WPX32984.1 ectoine hydroxylase [Actimicrobium sp. CCC2.4]
MLLSQDAYKSRAQSTAAILKRNEPVVYDEVMTSSAPALNAAQRDVYRENGFLMLPDLFSADEVTGLYDEMQQMRGDFTATGRAEVIAEPGSGEVRSIFDVHKLNALFANLVRDPRVLNVAREILGSEVYIHQSRINYKPGFTGKEFYWHSDFETWHTEDGMPAMRALSCSILLTDNSDLNGPLMLIPGSHRHFISCLGETPEDNYKKSLKKQEAGVPDDFLLRYLSDLGGITSCTGKAGSVVFFDCNTMHGSNGNITPYPRSNLFFVYNSVENQLQAPTDGLAPRPGYIAVRDDVDALEPEPFVLP